MFWETPLPFGLSLKPFLPQNSLTSKPWPLPGELWVSDLSIKMYNGGSGSNKLLTIAKPIGPLWERSKIIRYLADERISWSWAGFCGPSSWLSWMLGTSVLCELRGGKILSKQVMKMQDKQFHPLFLEMTSYFLFSFFNCFMRKIFFSPRVKCFKYCLDLKLVKEVSTDQPSLNFQRANCKVYYT